MESVLPMRTIIRSWRGVVVPMTTPKEMRIVAEERHLTFFDCIHRIKSQKYSTVKRRENRVKNFKMKWRVSYNIAEIFHSFEETVSLIWFCIQNIPKLENVQDTCHYTWVLYVLYICFFGLIRLQIKDVIHGKIPTSLSFQGAVWMEISTSTSTSDMYSCIN